MTTQSRQTIEDVVRQQWGYLYASLVKWLRDFDLAEDVLQEAFVVALERWPEEGIPPSPGAWLLKTARRKAIDRIRRQKNFELKSQQLALIDDINSAEESQEDAMVSDQIEDERLRLIFTCCHPAIAEPARVALTLRTLGGLQTRDIARAFLVSEKTMQQRLVRAKTKIRKTNIPFKIPGKNQWQERLDSVLAVLYLIFNEGYNASVSETLINADLCDEAIFLGRMLHQLIPDSPDVTGLLALLLLHDSRRDARHDDQGNYITLEDQDRSLWDQNKVSQGQALLSHSFSLGLPGAYQIQAAISALHLQAKKFEQTDWKQICFLYNRLYAKAPSPVVRLNAIMALSYHESVSKCLALLEELEQSCELQNYQPLHAAKADMLRRDGQFKSAIDQYTKAIGLSSNEVEKRFLQSRCDKLRKNLL